MKKRIIAIVCGIVAAAVIVTGLIISFSRMKESESIGSDTALSIALNDAGLSKNEVTNTKSNFEHDDGRYIFGVEFSSDNIEYEYYIDAKTGEILKSDSDIHRPQITSQTASQPQTTEQASSTTESTSQKASQATQASNKYIGLEAAKQISLDNAKVDAKDAVFRKAKIDYENGKAIYEIEFIKGSTEYEYEIDAESGTIIDSEAETNN